MQKLVFELFFDRLLNQFSLGVVEPLVTACQSQSLCFESISSASFEILSMSLRAVPSENPVVNRIRTRAEEEDPFSI